GRFDKLGTVNANGVSSVYTYQFTDNQPALRRYFYRLKIVEKSGAIEYSTTIILESNVAAGTRVKVLPNPVSEQFTVAFEKSVSGPIAVVISDMSGREVWKDERLANGDYNLGFSLSSRKPSKGSYIVNVYAQNQRTALPVLIQ
ncbi:MAG: T9SS type A sorting domain-containing protein, partial [Bacteroidota bacterium]|nr:T9SS type A sorting domain-containing protein [Bacteroidota bacterium]